MSRGRSVFQAVDVAEGAGDYHMVAVFEHIVAGGKRHGVVLLDREDVEPVLFAHVRADDVLAHPFVGHFDFEHAIVRAQLDEVEDVVGIEAESF